MLIEEPFCIDPPDLKVHKSKDEFLIENSDIVRCILGNTDFKENNQ